MNTQNAAGGSFGLANPSFLYGTAWKEDDTERLTLRAIERGFRGIDTANQRKHYHEAGVGAALQTVFCQGLVRREELFIQTKFTHQAGQDHRLPYDPRAPIATQVEQSFARSLEHLGVATLDSYVLHGPSTRYGLAEEDWTAWRAMEVIHARGQTRWLGVSNVTLSQLQLLCEQAAVPPRFVQNRCYAQLGWDRSVRKYCQERQMIYQGFSLLTANPQVLAQPAVTSLARKYGATPSQIVFCFAHGVGMLPLTGTRDPQHMEQDLRAAALPLTDEEMATIESCG